MTTKQSAEDLQTTIEGLEAEVDELSRRRAEALAQIRTAERRFEELEERRTILSPKAFSGDEEASAELEALEDEHDRVQRSVRVARSAVPEFERMIAEVRERLREAELQVHREQADELSRKSAALDSERDELAARLHEILEEQDRIYSERQQVINRYDQDSANRMASAGGATAAMRDWLEDVFGKWLL